MKTITLVACLLFTSLLAYSQVGIGTTDPKGALDVDSETLAFIVPRVADYKAVTDTDCTDPINGSLVYDTTLKQLMIYIDGSWLTMGKNTAGDAVELGVIVPVCGAFTAPGVFKEFLCHNLGADTNLDPNVPVEGIHGGYYQWGRNAPAATTQALISTWGSQGGTSADGNWSDAIGGGTNNPCPTGYRVPTSDEWAGVVDPANNTRINTGSWVNDGNFTTAISFGPDAITKTLTLPAAGDRNLTSGTLSNRGNTGYYWSSTELDSNAYYLLFNSAIVRPAFSSPRTRGFSVRCIAE
jgi:uncharacterized protein (TIGR02145 family)